MTRGVLESFNLRLRGVSDVKRVPILATMKQQQEWGTNSQGLGKKALVN